MRPPIELSELQLLSASSFMLVCLAVSRFWRLDLGREFAIASLRTVVQLLVLGALLGWVFDNEHPGTVLGVIGLFIAVAAWTAVGRQGRRMPGMLLSAGAALTAGGALVSLLAAALVIGVRPFWTPQYLIPLAGMMLANAMNASALAVERLRAEIGSRRSEIEELLSLGANARQAIDASARAALRAALRPTLNSMYVVGIVSIPGTMTGQILAGLDPSGAARYQILVMFMWATSSALTSALLVGMSYRRFFTPALQIRSELLGEG